MIDFNKSGVFARLKEASVNDSVMIQPLLIMNENVVSAYKTARDYVFFTTHRIISVNVQGITGSKKDYTSIPYTKIQTFSIETSGMFDMDAELEVYISSVGKVKFSFTGKTDVLRIAQIISEYTLK